MNPNRHLDRLGEWLAPLALLLLAACGGERDGASKAAASDTAGRKVEVTRALAAPAQLKTTSAATSVSKLTPPAGTPAEAFFGSTVAVQSSASGAFAAVGAPRELLGGTPQQGGAVYVSTLDGTRSWRLVPTDAAARFQFGRAVALDGPVLVVGAVQAAYVFRFDGENWLEEARLEQDCSQGRFGSAVAVSGERILVGAPLRGCLQATVEGNVFAYRHTGGGTWALERQLAPHPGTVGSHYGSALAIDGQGAAVGAPGWGEVFTYRHDGTTWQTGERIVDPVWGSGRSFGRAVALQGSVLVVGIPGDSEVREGAGAAYVYRQATDGRWSEEGKLLPPPTKPAQKLTGAYYGLTAGLSGDLIVLGGPQADLEDEAVGAVLVFGRDGGAWKHRTTLAAADAGSGDELGTALDIDNGVVLAGAPGHDQAGSNTGAAYVIVLEGGATSPPPAPGNQPPTASFTSGCNGLTCQFDASSSKDADGRIEKYAWHFGDTHTALGVTVSHSFASWGQYSVSLIVTDDAGKSVMTTSTVTVNDSAITLSARGYKVQALQKVDLSWSGAAAPQADIWFSSNQQSEFWGVKVATVANGGAYTHAIDRRRGSTYQHWVCEAGRTDRCSNKTTTTFQ